MDDFKLYTIDEIAKVLKVTERTIYNYIRSGALHALKIGKYWRVKHQDLEQFLSIKTST
jgi:excisionase family DNA binding protein